MVDMVNQKLKGSFLYNLVRMNLGLIVTSDYRPVRSLTRKQGFKYTLRSKDLNSPGLCV